MNGQPSNRTGGVVLRVISGILLTVVLVLTNVRLLLTPAFVTAEYASPGFPDDPYGFSRAERVEYARLALEYLLNDSDETFLGVLTHTDGTPLYNSRELGHMVDVKRLVQAALTAWLACASLLGLALALTARLEGTTGLRRTLHSGGRLCLILMAVLIGVLAVSFTFLFVGFHNIFFDSGTWLFSYSDTLIRLFPQRFWRDAFGLLLLLTLAEGGAIALATRPRRTAAAAGAGPSGPAGSG